MSKDLDRLLDNSPEAYYWAGFLMADGTVVGGKRVALELGRKDRGHVRKFARFIGGSLDRNNRMTAQHASIVPTFAKKFGFRRDKTRNPPKRWPRGDQDLRFAFAVGFVDGDGSISRQSGRRDYFLRVKCHASWRTILGKMRAELTGEEGEATITSLGYANFSICNSVTLKEIKKRALMLRLPLLKRKWSVVDMTFVGQRELGQIRLRRAKELFSLGFRKGAVARDLGVHPSTVTAMIRRNKLDV